MEQECNLIKFWNCPASVKMTLDKNAINIQTEEYHREKENSKALLQSYQGTLKSICINGKAKSTSLLFFMLYLWFLNNSLRVTSFVIRQGMAL